MCNLIAYSKTSVNLQNICLQDTNFIEDTGVQNACKTFTKHLQNFSPPDQIIILVKHKGLFINVTEGRLRNRGS